MRAEANLAWGRRRASTSARPVVLLAVMAVLAGCAGPPAGQGRGTQARQPVVLTQLANFIGDSGELDGFAGEVRRLSAGTMRIDIGAAGVPARSIPRTG